MENNHFAFCFDENYVNYACVCIRSIALTNTRYNNIIHVLSDSLSEKAKDCIQDAASGSKCNAEIHIIDDSILSGLPRGIWPIQAWYRILLPEVLPKDVSKVLYLDCDTLVMSDLSELFKLDLCDRAFAAVTDPQSFSEETFERCHYIKEKGYICSGIMLMNLNYWRAHNLKEKLIDLAISLKDTVKFPDQDCLNILCQDSKILLPYKYGVMQWYFIEDIRNRIVKNELYECLYDPKIVHFAGCSPWNKALRPALYSSEWDKINSTLINKAIVKYHCEKSLLIKSFVYKILHPFQTIKKRNSRFTYKNIVRHWNKNNYSES